MAAPAVRRATVDLAGPDILVMLPTGAVRIAVDAEAAARLVNAEARRYVRSQGADVVVTVISWVNPPPGFTPPA